MKKPSNKKALRLTTSTIKQISGNKIAEVVGGDTAPPTPISHNCAQF